MLFIIESALDSLFWFAYVHRSTPPNFQPFQDFMKAISDELKVQATLIHEVFPPNADVYYIFADRVFEDVVSVNELLRVTAYM